jgi:hypothetical protein
MNIRMKRLALLVSLALASLTTACGGGGGSNPGPPPPPPPPPGAKFSNASLAGQYAFSMTGTESCGGQGSFFGRAGTFTADGNGSITTGLEDVNVCTGVATIPFTGGTYSIGADGRGVVALTNSTGTTNYSITLSTATAGSITQTDVAVTASGTFERQNSAAFANAAIAGGYVFDFKGVDVSGPAASPVVNPASIVGRFDADGSGNVSNGLYDSNIGGTLSGQQSFATGAFCKIDATTSGSGYGRGTAHLAGQDFAFYVVDATRLKLVGTSFPSAYIGDAFAQQNTAFTVPLSGNFAFLIGGSGSSVPIATGGRFTADGGGNVTNVVVDENSNGVVTLLPNGTVTGTYTVDTNQFGGGTLTWTDTKVGTFSFIFYLASPTRAVFQETDSNIVSDGSFSAQTTSPVSAASLAGDYVLAWSGVNTGGEEDFIGQVTLTSTGSFSGHVDFNDFATGTQLFDVPASGSLTLNGDGTQANTLTVNAQTSLASAFNFTVYVVNPNTLLLVGVDTTRVVAGTMTRQP